MAGDQGPVRHLDLGGPAAADPGGGRHPLLPPVPGYLPHRGLAGLGAARGRPAGVGGAWVLRPGPQPPPGRAGGGGTRRIPHYGGGVACASRRGALHRGRNQQHRLRPRRPGRRRERPAGGRPAPRHLRPHRQPSYPAADRRGPATAHAAREGREMEPSPHGPRRHGVSCAVSSVRILPGAEVVRGRPKRHAGGATPPARGGLESAPPVRGRGGPGRRRTRPPRAAAGERPLGRAVGPPGGRSKDLAAGAARLGALRGHPAPAIRKAARRDVHPFIHPLRGRLHRGDRGGGRSSSGRPLRPAGGAGRRRPRSHPEAPAPAQHFAYPHDRHTAHPFS